MKDSDVSTGNGIAVTAPPTPARRSPLESGERLEQVLELAECLPVRHSATLRYPPLIELVRDR